MATKATKTPAVQVRVTLRDIEPPIWRRLVLPGGWHLGRVHQVLQIAFGWYGGHLHEFQVGHRRFGPADPYGMDAKEREVIARVHEVLGAPGDSLTYWYNFGDDWFHDVGGRGAPAASAARALSRR